MEASFRQSRQDVMALVQVGNFNFCPSRFPEFDPLAWVLDRPSLFDRPLEKQRYGPKGIVKYVRTFVVLSQCLPQSLMPDIANEFVADIVEYLIPDSVGLANAFL